MQISLLAALVLSGPSVPPLQLQDPTPKPIIGVRSLALSPDGKQLAFSYQGDIWVGPATGGRAVPLTNHIEMDDYPLWSPDGKWIAFASNRNGSNDIYVVPAEGGESQRLTHNSSQDVPSDWSVDGKKLLFWATREDGYAGIYEMDVRTTQEQLVLLDNVSLNWPRYAADGEIVYTRMGFPWTRPRYSGSGAYQLWRYDRKANKRTAIRKNDFQHLWPRFGGNNWACVTVSEPTPSSSSLGKPIPKIIDNPNRTPNVYKFDFAGKANRITDFVGGAVRYLTLARDTGAMAFEYEGAPYLIQPGGKPIKVAITITYDPKTSNEERLILTNGVEEAVLNPKGDQVAFGIRGELWSVPVEKGKGPNKDDAKQLTDWAGRDGQPLFSPDGKSLYFTSDREGSNRIFRENLETGAIVPVTQADHDAYDIKLTPDKKSLSYFLAGKEGGLYLMPVEGGAAKKVLDEPTPGSGCAWSPDGKYVAYVYNSTNRTENIVVGDVSNGKKVNVTKLNVSHGSPVWSPDGKYLYFTSNREGPGIYLIPLQREEIDAEQIEMVYKKPEGAVNVLIDFNDIQRRIRKLVTVDAASLQVDSTTGEIYFTAAGEIFKVSYSGGNPQQLTGGAGVGGFDFNAETGKLFFIGGGMPMIMDVRKQNRPVTVVSFRTDWTRDIRLERKAAFMEFWRGYNRMFYDGNFHGRDWVKIRERYLPLLSSVGHRNEMATLLNMVVGELEASHSEVGPGAGNPPVQPTAHLGFTIDYSYLGPGLKIKSVPEGTPGSFAKSQLSPGEVVLKINGKPVLPNEALWKELNGQAGREITLLVSKSGAETGARTVKYRALSSQSFQAVLYDNQIAARRKMVEEKSGGKLTYLHISGMGQNNFQQFNREAWEFLLGKEGVIVDVRNNGGGNISDRLIDQIERIPHTYFVPRDGEPYSTTIAWNVPTVVLCAESSYSNAEMFPYAMKNRGLATIIGKRTPGYVIGTFGFPLVDGTSARMPTEGVYRLDGSNLEDNGEKPDIEVEYPPEEFFAGRDPQLEKAIEVLVKKIK